MAKACAAGALDKRAALLNKPFHYNFAAGYLAAEHLLRLGRQRLVFLMRPQSAATVEVRIAGVREAQARFNVEPASDWILAGDLEMPIFSPRPSARAAGTR